MKKSELRSLIRECVCDALKEASYKPADDEFIEQWVREELSKNGKLAIGDAVVDKAIDNIKEEWKEAASRFPTVRGYLMDLRKQGVFDELLESKINEATMVDFANYYRAYDSDVKEAAKALDKIIEESGAGSEELFDAITDLVDAVRADTDAEF
jgi:uncharacterized protein YjgD (DUF1641 family)